VSLQIPALNERPSELYYHKDPRSAFLFQSSDHSASGSAEFNSTNFLPQLFRLTDVFRAVFCSVHFMLLHKRSYTANDAVPTVLLAYRNVCHYSA
jgi:hypothetical protein